MVNVGKYFIYGYVWICIYTVYNILYMDIHIYRESIYGAYGTVLAKKFCY